MSLYTRRDTFTKQTLFYSQNFSPTCTALWPTNILGALSIPAPSLLFSNLALLIRARRGDIRNYYTAYSVYFSVRNRPGLISPNCQGPYSSSGTSLTYPPRSPGSFIFYSSTTPLFLPNFSYLFNRQWTQRLLNFFKFL